MYEISGQERQNMVTNLQTNHTTQSAPQEKQIYHVLVRNTKHGDVHMRSMRFEDGRYYHLLSSHRYPNVTYTVTVDRPTNKGACNCPAHSAHCWHIGAALKAENAVSLWLWEVARDMHYSECTDFYIDALALKERIESGKMEVQA